MKLNKKDELRLKLYERDGKNCHYCEIEEGDFIPIWGKFEKGRGKILELDRKDNENKSYSEENCVLACAICNNAKSNKFTCEEFREVGKAIKKIWLLRKELIEQSKETAKLNIEVCKEFEHTEPINYLRRLSVLDEIYKAAKPALDNFYNYGLREFEVITKEKRLNILDNICQALKTLEEKR